MSNDRNFWLKTLAGPLQKSCFPYDHLRSEDSERKMSPVAIALPPGLSERILAVSNRSHLRLYVLLSAALVALLHKYTDSEDIIIGAPVDRQDSTADFINTVLTLRIPISNQVTFKQLLALVGKSIANASKHVNYPLDILLSRLGVPFREGCDFPLFDVIIMLDNLHHPDYIKQVHTNTLITFHKTRDSIQGVLEYNRNVFTEATIKRVLTHYRALLEQALQNPDLPLSEIGILSSQDKQQLLAFSATGATIPHGIPGNDFLEWQWPAAHSDSPRPAAPDSEVYRSIYILSRHNRLLPPGVPGYLCLESEPTLPGFTSPDLPDIQLHLTRLRACWLPDGKIRYLGLDSAIKNNVYKLDTREINAVLAEFNGVQQAAVRLTTDLDDNPCLCAYLQPLRFPGNLDVAALRKFLIQKLPLFMIPRRFIMVDRIPMTPEGNLAQEQLPIPGREILSTFRLPPQELPPVPEPDIQYSAISQAEEREYYALSSAQKRMYVLRQLDPGSTVYNVPQIFEYTRGTLDPARLEQTFKQLIHRHESLRTSFGMVDYQPVQFIHQPRDIDFAVRFCQPSSSPLDRQLKEFIRPFDLTLAPLVRVGVMETSPEENLLIVDMHHIISDGVSHEVLVADFVALYKGHTLPPLRLQYKDFAQWQQQEAGQQDYLKLEKFWLEEFRAPLPVLQLPTDWPRPPVQSFHGNAQDLILDNNRLQALKNCASAEGVTLYMILLAIINILLSRLSGQQDIIIGTPVAGRRHADLQKIIGMFINTLPLRNYPEAELTFREFLHNLKRNTLQAFEHQEYPFEDLVNKLDLERDAGRSPLFDVNFVLQNFEIVSRRIGGSEEETKYREAPAIRLPEEIAKFDITFTAAEMNDSLMITAQYVTALFKKETIQRFFTYFSSIINKVLENPDIQLAHIELLSKEEKETILQVFNDTNVEIPTYHITLHKLFQAQAEKTPHLPAVIHEQECLSYETLNTRSNRLASFLCEKGIRTGDMAALLLERSVDMVVAILAVLKAGGAYVPIDTEYPEKRVQYIMQDCEAKVLLTHDKWIQNQMGNPIHRQYKCPTISIENEKVYDHDIPAPDVQVQAADLAYVIYTSGSTGKPKGNLIEHRHVQVLVNGLEQLIYNRYHGNLRVALVAPYVFDASVKQIFAALLLGHSLYIVPRETRLEGGLLLDFYSKNRILITDGTPAHLKLMLPNLHAWADKLQLEHLIIGGEAMPKPMIETFLSYFNHHTPCITNVYGPAECCVDVTTFDISKENIHRLQKIPIGKPMPNRRIYILNPSNQLQPIGVTGELCIGGAGVGRGYLKREQLTREKFINDPYNKGGLLYKTGDLAYWLPNGDIRFVGRSDHQVKVRGYRIELGEIENLLMDHHTVKAAVVTARQDKSGDNFLYAYVNGSPDCDTRALKEYLSQNLPQYMVPFHWLLIDEIPLTPNGKVDRDALPEPGKTTGQIEYIPPSGAVEELLVELWADVLELESGTIGVADNFFELGGHSLKGTSMLAKVHKELEVRVPLMELFKTPRIRDLALYIKEAAREQFIAIEPAEEKEYYVLSSPQKRMYVLRQFEPDSTVYNVPQVFEFTRTALEPDKLEPLIKQLIARHESLRTSFHMVDRQPVQIVHQPGDIDFKIDYYQSDSLPLAQQMQDFIRPFDLALAPLLRVAVREVSPENYLLLVDMHHIISDGVSHEVLVADFTALSQGQSLPPLRIQYKDYAQWQQQGAGQQNQLQLEKFWLEQFMSPLPLLQLPTDWQRPPVQNFQGDSLDLKLDPQQLHALKDGALAEGATLYIMLLAILNIWLSRLSSQEDIIIGTPAAGRRHADLQKIIGMFINTLPLRNFPKSQLPFREFLHSLKNNTLQAFEHQEYPFEDLVDKLDLQRDAGRNPLFDVMFVLQNFDMESRQNNHTPGEEQEIGEQKPTAEAYRMPERIVKFDITLTAMEIGDFLMLTIQYATALFKKETIQRFFTYFTNIAAAVIAEPDMRLADIDILPAKEREQLLFAFNDTQVEIPLDLTFLHLFQQQVQQTPDRNAAAGNLLATLRAGGNEISHWSYQQLDTKANAIAHTLKTKGIGPNRLAALLAEPSLEMLLAIMAILKAGGAFIPILETTPPARVNYILSDSSAQILLTRQELLPSITAELEVLPLEDEAIYYRQDENLEPLNSLADLAYIIYTSGSTGKPKGAMIDHRCLINMCHWHNRFYAVKAEDRAAQYASISFDASILDIFPYLIIGAAVYVVPSRIKLDMHELNCYFEENKISITFLPTQVYEQFAEVKNQSLRSLITGGDRLKRFIKRNYQLYNIYGPTENTVVTTVYPVNEICPDIPIGKPVANHRVYILGPYKQLQPVGVAGELCISGYGLGRGYLNNIELSNEKFVSNPLEPGERIYRTGDLACWLKDGNLRFIGRIDHQVKVRGFRIELGEIETHLQAHEAVKMAVVLARRTERGENYLCAYMVCEYTVAADALKKHLSRFLPDYMVPPFFVFLEQLPLTVNGKVDRRALPAPGKSDKESAYVAPADELEEQLVIIWAQILEMDAGEIGVLDNFFDLGGHSLRATTLVTQVHKEMDVKVPLIELFRNPFIRHLALYIKEAAREQFIAIKPAEKREYYPLTSAQQRLFVLQQMEPTGTVYNMPELFQLQDEPDRQKLELTFLQLMARHESLRTSFHMMDQEPVQVIHHPNDVPFGIEHYPAGTTPVEQVMLDFIRPFDLSRAPLVRVGATVTHQGHHLLMVDMHHIISDGVSHEVLLGDFMALYQGRSLPPLSIQYKDFALWQKQDTDMASLHNQELSWLEMFHKPLPVLQLPTSFSRPAVQSFQGDAVNIELDSPTFQALKDYALSEGVTLYMALLAVFNILLSRLSGQEDIIIGTPVAGRRHADLQRIIGMFINTLALRNYPKANTSFREFLQQVKEHTLAAFENQEYPFEDLVEKLDLERDAARNAIFDVMFVLQNFEKQSRRQNHHEEFRHHEKTKEKEGNTAESTFEGCHLPYHTAKFDMTLTAMEADDYLLLSLQYATALFDKETIEGFFIYLRKIITSILENPDIRLADIDILSAAEKETILESFNNPQVDMPPSIPLHHMFAEQVQKTPHLTAVVHEQHYLSYEALNIRSDQLASLLCERGIQIGDIVALLVERSLEMVVAIMGVLKAGGAYVPIDPHYPEKRIHYILQDCEAKVLLTGDEFTNNQSQDRFQCETINLKNDSIYKGDTLSPLPQVQPSDLAYVIYTSGSTGKPKGNLIEHRHVQVLVKGLEQLVYQRYVGQLWAALVAPYVFDASVQQIFAALLLGHSLYIVPEETRIDGEGLLDFYRENHIDVSDGTPAHLKLMLPALSRGTTKLNLKHLIIGGEELPLPVTERFLNYFSSNAPCITNVYGPAECCVDVTAFDISKENIPKLQHIPIGKPMPNRRIYILNPNHRLQPIGVTGELCIGGAGVGRGYLKREQLTHEKFINDPYNQGGSLYKTGDLASWLPNGDIRFVGRSDQQVKVRGYRIELGEIENLLLDHGSIDAAIVLARQDKSGDNYLCAYVKGSPDCNIEDIEALKEYLTQNLPGYMVPSHWQIIAEIPLTPNGKVDRDALPEPGKSRSQIKYIPPSGAVEELLVELWADVLELDTGDIGVTDNFFERGGHSLKGTAMLAKVHKELQVRVPLVELFKTPRIRDLARYIKHAELEAYFAIEPAEAADYYPLSSAQRRIFILQHMELQSTLYNMPEMFPLQEKPQPENLQQAFMQLIQRHESLRTSFHVIEGQPVQRIHSPDQLDFPINLYLPAETEVEATIFDFVQPFDLTTVPLVRAALLETPAQEFILMVDMHHIISDGMSHEILLADCLALYEQRQLPGLKLHYKDFAQWQNSAACQEGIQRQETFWLQQFQPELPVLQLPTDFPRPPIQRFTGESIDFQLDKSISQALKACAQSQGTTLYMVLLAAFNILLARLSGQEDIIVGTPVAGRRHADLQKIIGMFVNTLALRNYPKGILTFRQFLAALTGNTLAAFDHQEYPFEDLVEKLDLERDASRNPLFDVMFIMQNFDMADRGTITHNQKSQSIPGDSLPGQESQYRMANNIAKFDITLTTMETDETLMLTLQYCTALFKQKTMQCFFTYFSNIAAAVIAEPDMLLADIDMLPAKEREQLLFAFNDTQTEIPPDQTFLHLFQQQVQQTPDRTAAAGNLLATLHAGSNEISHWSYEQLDKKANHLALTLKAKGIGPNRLAALLVEPSLEMLLAIMAILKAGGAFIPILETTPPTRVNYILSDSSAKILLTRQELLPTITAGLDVLVLEDETIDYPPDEYLEPVNTLSDLAYIIYTSGSTGKPKGVMIEHRSLVNTCYWHNRFYDVLAEDRSAQYASISFDPSMLDIFPYLIMGAAVYIVPTQIKLDMHELNRYFEDNRISITFLPTQVYEQFAEVENRSLRTLIAGGDRLKRFIKRDYQLYNLYGPTENTIVTTIFPVNEPYADIPIGKPITNHRVYILGQHDQLQPVGVPGELCVSGYGLARGYLNNPGQSNEKFITNPLVRGERMYRTGDLACWMPDGNLRFLGRIDHQVKVRGFRIELGEIETLLQDYEAVSMAVVMAHRTESGENYLCAYLVCEQSMTADDLKFYLSGFLPDYMIPAFFVFLEEFPLTSSGKVNRKALPKPEITANGDTYVAPVNNLEKQLVAIWSQILKLDAGEIGVLDNFFYLGGHSLRASLMVSRIQEQLGVRIPMVDIFHTPQVRQLAMQIKQLQTIPSDCTSESLVLMRKSRGLDKARSLFLVHDALGSVEALTALCKQVSSSFDFWAIRAQAISGTAAQNISMETLAEKYVRVIREHQPDGPYYLAGWSVGGAIALEIARQLEQQNQTISFLGVMDTIAPSRMTAFNNRKINLKSELQLARKIFLDDPAMLRKLKKLKDPEEVWSSVIEYVESGNFDLKTFKRRVLNFGLQALPNFHQLGARQCILQLNTGRTFTNTAFGYFPGKGKLKVPLHYFKASGSLALKLKLWNRLTYQPIRMHHVEGDHFTMLKPPHVSSLATALEEILGNMAGG